MFEDRALGAALAALAPPGVRVKYRLIGPNDHEALRPCEQAAFAKRVIKGRQQSGAARIAAREGLAHFGFGDAEILRAVSGAPQWPPGIVGSLAHDAEVAVAAIAAIDTFLALGIDVEPATALPEGVGAIVATPCERRRYTGAQLDGRLLFVIKEAVFKALHPLDGVFLDFQDIEVDLDAKVAETTSGQSIALTFTTSPRVIALAFRSVTT